MKPPDIQQYIDGGFTVIRTEGKRPTEKDWVNIPFRAEIPDGLTDAPTFGVKLDAIHLVVDNDQRNYKDGVNSLEKLQQHLGLSLFQASTFVVQTGSGGHHFYFNKPKDLEIQHTIPAFPGLEFKTNGRQVIGAGSIHPDTGKEYEVFVTSLSPKKISPAPKALLDLIQKKTVSQIRFELPDFTNNDFDVRRAKDALSRLAPAVQGEQGDHATYLAAVIGFDFGLSPDIYAPLLAEWNETCIPPWEPGELHQKLMNAYRYAKFGRGNKSIEADFPRIASIFDLPVESTPDQEKSDMCTLSSLLAYWPKTTIPRPTFGNLTNFLRYEPTLKNTFWYNEMSCRMVMRRSLPWKTVSEADGTPVTDDDLLELKEFFTRRHRVEFASAMIVEGVRWASLQRNFHPVRSYLGSLAWDRTPRLGRWLPAYLGAEDTPYTQAIGKKFLVAAVARIYNPGCKFDFMLHMEGAQGIGKSTCCNILFAPWYTDALIDLSDKDGVLLLQGNWGIEFGETASFQRSEVEVQKSFITRQTDRIRAPYDRLTREYKRQCVFISTTNRAVYSDETGNRRWWVVRVKQLDFDALIRDRDQLWAEAMYWFEAGEKLFLDTPELNAMAGDQQMIRYEDDVWQDTIEKYLADSKRTTLADVWTKGLERWLNGMTLKDQTRVSKILTRLGWDRRSENGQKVYVKV